MPPAPGRREAIDEARRREAETVLARVDRDAEAFGTSAFARSMRRLESHFAGADADPGDTIEVWGRRIGRGLAVVAVVTLAAHLLFTYVLSAHLPH